MARALLYYGVFAIAAFVASCKSSEPPPADPKPSVVDASLSASPVLDASSPSAAIPDAGDTVAVSHGRVVLVSDADARTFAAAFIDGAKFAHPVFSGNFGPSASTLFGITQTEMMAPYEPLVLVRDISNGGAWKKIETDPITDTPWNGWSVDAVMFEDIDQTGTLSPIVIAQYMTGIGPTGAQPFVVVSVFRWKDAKMRRARDIERLLSGAEDAKTIRSRLATRKTPKNPPL
jgi:hypothetical protein